MEQTLFISDAAKKVHVEAHVLRYWEEELELPIKRNELGHRYYTEEDVKRFQEIRELKERGLQLKAIRLILKNGKLDRLSDGENTQAEKAAEAAKIAEKMPADAQHGKKNVEVLKTAEKVTGEEEPIKTTSVVGEESREEKAARLQWLLKQPSKKTRKKSRSFCNSNGTDSGAVFGQTDVSAVFRWAGVSAAAAEGFWHRNSSRNRQGRE